MPALVRSTVRSERLVVCRLRCANGSAPSTSFIFQTTAAGNDGACCQLRVQLPWRSASASSSISDRNLLELGNQTVSFARTGQVAHAFVSVGSLHIAIEEEVNPIDVLGAAHEKRAADAKSSSGAANAQTGVAAVAKGDGVQATV